MRHPSYGIQASEDVSNKHFIKSLILAQDERWRRA